MEMFPKLVNGSQMKPYRMAPVLRDAWGIMQEGKNKIKYVFLHEMVIRRMAH